ncbi:hypothetical protein B0A48_10889 [Cryoendolithus antarcticus]|uniref:Heterokaryon incompatibility domain-containing protein n=1 Tax=Cryoendolithus antarcticus TaxID=1507870 RepID=A0A1V8SZ90_9PEZI|nr:hypothetical protein B0A48_10889 [Cryoendolithus antarcticus]
MATSPDSDDDRPKPQKYRKATPSGPGRQDTIPVPTAEKLRSAAAAFSKMYQYEPLLDGHARLLILKKRQEKNEDVVFDILHVPFDQLGTKEHRYEALSYHWGPGDATKTIYLNNVDAQIRLPDDKIAGVAQAAALAKTYLHKHFKVKLNLYDALDHLRSWQRDIKVWVDAICIHQDNRAEKEKQVARMSEIYSKAKRVLIWLGPSDDQTRRAMKFLNTELTNLDRINDLVTDVTRVHAWEDLLYLMRSSWFSRRWVIQELAFAQDATVHCGSDEIHWNGLRDGISIFSDQFDTIRKMFRQFPQFGHDYNAMGEVDALPAKKLIDTINNIFKKQQTRGNYKREPIQGLEYLVSILSTYDTSDPRDTINAFRNIAKETYITSTPGTSRAAIEMPPALDYTRSLLDVYTGFIKWIYTNTGCIDILCRRWAMAERKAPVNDYPPLSALPSWIQTVDDANPSDRALGRRRHGDCFVGMPGHGPYNACHNEKANVKFGIDIESPIAQQPPTTMSQDASVDVAVRFHIAQQHLQPRNVTERSRQRSRSPSDLRSPTNAAPVADVGSQRTLNNHVIHGPSHDNLTWTTSQIAGSSDQQLQNGETSPTMSMPIINAVTSSDTPSLRDSGYFSGALGISRPGSPVPAVSPLATEGNRAGGSRRDVRDSSIHVEGLLIGRVGWCSDPTTDGIVPASALLKLFGLNQIPEEIDEAPDKVWRTLVAERGSKGEQAPGLYQTACAYVLSNVTVNGYINTKELLSGDPPYMVKAYLKRVHEVIWDRCFIEVESQGPELGAGKVLHGLAPNKARDTQARNKDVLCVLFGCTVPVLLREYQDSRGQTSYHLIGETYVYGLMDGEAILSRSKEELDADKRVFRIN